ncbi:MAG: hypothetical protein IBJ11_06170, partial [Phycisphaerales bacterium]|nr:hypothetical protein [Phycisphaerales bacterium]
RDPPAPGGPPLPIPAPLDHPAFVVEAINGRVLDLSFRGGVNDPYFTNAPIVLYTSDDRPVRARITATRSGEPWRTCTAELIDADPGLARGDVGRWDLPEPAVESGLIHTHACDDLAALAAALAAIDELRRLPAAAHVRLLFTRAEEIGFIGAIAACKLGTIPRGARVLALENSRSFPHDSPIGAGPIVRVGDRISTFSPTLTAAVAKVCESLAKDRPGPDGFRWQRKLMPGGACEASAFQCYGHDATCVCLPLGNYHNMADLDLVQSGDPHAAAHARAGREFVSADDYHNLIDLLVACATRLADAEPLIQRMEKLYADKKFVLG